jgi:hypothetical protein
LNVAFESVPSVSLPDAVKLTARGADPEATELANAKHVGAALAAAMVGVAITGVGDAAAVVGVTALLGDVVGDVVEGVGDV